MNRFDETKYVVMKFCRFSSFLEDLCFLLFLLCYLEVITAESLCKMNTLERGILKIGDNLHLRTANFVLLSLG